jgi:hypothetical protein
MAEQTGERHAVGIGELGLADPALRHRQLMAQRRIGTRTRTGRTGARHGRGNARRGAVRLATRAATPRAVAFIDECMATL